MRQPSPEAIRIEHLRIDAERAVGLRALAQRDQIVAGMSKGDDPALRKHDVEIEITRKAFPKFEGVLVETRRLGPQVVGADNGGVAPRIAAAEPPLVKHQNVTDAVFLGKIIGRGEPVPSRADDNDVIDRLGLGATPNPRPGRVTGQAVSGKAENRVSSHPHRAAIHIQGNNSVRPPLDIECYSQNQE